MLTHIFLYDTIKQIDYKGVFLINKTCISTIAAILAVVLLLGMSSCSSDLFAGKGITVNVVNEVPDRLTSIDAAFHLESANTTKLFSNASVGSFLEAKTYTFTLKKRILKTRKT